MNLPKTMLVETYFQNASAARSPIFALLQETRNAVAANHQELPHETNIPKSVSRRNFRKRTFDTYRAEGDQRCLSTNTGALTITFCVCCVSVCGVCVDKKMAQNTNAKAI